MNFRFLYNIPWFKPQITCKEQDQKPLSVDDHLRTASKFTSNVIEQKNQKAGVEVNLWRWSISSIDPLVVYARDNIPWLKGSQENSEGTVKYQLVDDDYRLDAKLKSSIEQPKNKPLFDIKLPGLSIGSINAASENGKIGIPWLTDQQVCEEQQKQKSQFVNDNPEVSGKFASTIIERQKWKPQLDMKLWGWSVDTIQSIVPWNLNAKNSFSNRELKRRGRVGVHGVVETSGGSVPLRFRPYVSKVPWHTGPRAFLSQFFPRYGHYCGPNWSSGKNGGSHIWDKRPIDWLDFCCYCHDIGYDTHDQATLLKADLAFLECLEKPHMSVKGDFQVAHLYKTMCITGLRNILIPYRNHILQLQSGQPSINFGWLSNIRWKNWNPQKS